MIFSAIWESLLGIVVSEVQSDSGTETALVQLLMPICRISFTYAQCDPPQRLPRGGRPRLLLRRGRRPLLLAVGRLAGDRHAGGRAGGLVDRAQPRRRPPDRGGGGAGRPRRRDPRRHGDGRGR